MIRSEAFKLLSKKQSCKPRSLRLKFQWLQNPPKPRRMTIRTAFIAWSCPRPNRGGKWKQPPLNHEKYMEIRGSKLDCLSSRRGSEPLQLETVSPFVGWFYPEPKDLRWQRCPQKCATLRHKVVSWCLKNSVFPLFSRCFQWNNQATGPWYDGEERRKHARKKKWSCNSIHMSG